MGRTTIFFFSCILTFFIINGVQARPGKRYDEGTKMCRILDNGTLDWESDNWGIGAQKFKAVCKSCHTPDNNAGASFLYMESYSPKVCNNVFSKRIKKCARDGSWDVLSKNELMMVND